MNETQQESLFLSACRRMPVTRTPVWFMRQAGRYLAEYRAVREKVDFLTLCKTPDLAAEVTIQPVDLVGVDAAIIFSDILVVPEAMGMKLIVEEGKGGPQFPTPVRSAGGIDHLDEVSAAGSLGFVYDALRETRRRLNDRVPLIGFSGAPWTLAAYMIEGRGSKDFRTAKQVLFSSPDQMHRMLEKVTRVVSEYLAAQIEAGAQAVQIFDTWAGLLSPAHFEEFSLRYIRDVVTSLKTKGAPVIVFCKGAGHALDQLASLGADVIGIDWGTDIGAARSVVGERAALQGNLDPIVLFAPPDRIEHEVREVLKKFGIGPGHIFNLGHGILPNTPVEHVRAFVQAVKTFSPQYHKGHVPADSQ